MRSLLPVSFLNFFAFRARITGANVSFKNRIPSTNVNPVANTNTHITQRQVVRRETKPAIMGAIVGAIGGPNENTATAFPRSFASHISANTPAPIASGAPPPSPERNRKTASCAVSCDTAQAMLNIKNIAVDTCNTMALRLSIKVHAKEITCRRAPTTAHLSAGLWRMPEQRQRQVMPGL